MKLFAIKVGNAIGSFAPIELLKQTQQEIDKIINLNPKNFPEEKREDWENLAEQLKQARLYVVEATLIEEKNIND